MTLSSMSKRIFDVVVSATALIGLSPVFLTIALVVWAASGRNVFFVQTRLGFQEQPFPCFKFRTLRQGAPIAPSHEIDSGWVTPIGRMLRKAKLDELPQFANVLRGDMSLVGPRPCLPVMTDVIAARRRLGVFGVRPGITGIAQLRGIDMSTPERLASADRSYIDRRTFLLDLRILFITVTRGSLPDKL